MLEIVNIERKTPAPIIRVRVEQLVESEYESEWYEFYRTEEDMEKACEDFEKAHKNPDGSWIPNINYIKFEKELVTFDEAKADMTLAQFEALYGVNVEDLL